MICQLMLIEPHLNLKELFLHPGGEWVPDGRCWTVARLAVGFGYCLYHGSANELRTGDLMVAGPNLDVTLRASQLGEVRLEFFRVVPQRLNGLITVVEWRQLEGPAAQAAPRVFRYAANEAPARRFARLAALPERGSLAVRSAWLQLWASCVGEVLHPPSETVTRKKNLETAFRWFISRLSEQDLAGSSMADLAAQLNCSERHLSRLFRAEFGMSLREKQTDINLRRACQLLADPSLKIRKIAHDMGFSHVSFFNSSFKRRFGVTPKEWRHRYLPAAPERCAKTTEVASDAGPADQGECAGLAPAAEGRTGTSLTLTVAGDTKLDLSAASDGVDAGRDQGGQDCPCAGFGEGAARMLSVYADGGQGSEAADQERIMTKNNSF